MTREEIIRMALESKSCVKTDCNGVRLIADGLDIERFAALVAAASEAKEREACAKVCDEFESDTDPDAGAVLASAIRERSANARARGQA